MMAASLIIAMALFNIRIGKVTASGIELINFSTGTVVAILLAVLLYHAAAFVIRAYEEYRIWELQLTAKQATYYGGGMGIVELANKLKDLSDLFDNIFANSGQIAHQNQNVISKADADQLKEAASEAITYGKRLRNFPTIVRIRFWFWDLGVAGFITVIALMFVFSILPTGAELFCRSVSAPMPPY